MHHARGLGEKQYYFRRSRIRGQMYFKSPPTTHRDQILQRANRYAINPRYTEIGEGGGDSSISSYSTFPRKLGLGIPENRSWLEDHAQRAR